jgi:methylmalonyl-CoA/ethylmalonyl-CoA epimerase
VISGVHHVNILVRDLAEARVRYARLLGLEFGEPVELPARGALTARARAGATWIVLVQPTRPDGVPGRRLAERGEGLFLLSLAVDDLGAEVAAAAQRGARFAADGARRGLDGWSVIDFDPAQTGGLELQLCAEAPPAGSQRARDAEP